MAPATPPPTPPSLVPFLDPLPGLIPHGSICTLSAASGTGKTRMIAGWLKRWQEGRSICLRKPNPLPGFGIITVDRRWSQYKELFNLVGLPDIPHYSFRDHPTFQWANLKTVTGRIGALSMALDSLKLPQGSAVVVDPLSVFVTNRLMDYHEVAIGMSEIDKQISGRRLTLIGTFHTHKVYANPGDRTLRPQDRILGSGAQLGFTDTAIYLASPLEMNEPYFELGFIPHNSAPEQHHFSMDKHGLFIPYEAAKSVGTVKGKDERIAMMVEIVRQAGQDGIYVRQLFELCQENNGVSQATFYRDLRDAEEHLLINIDELSYVRAKPIS